MKHLIVYLFDSFVAKLDCLKKLMYFFLNFKFFSENFYLNIINIARNSY